jgi:hypothetical protein
MPLVVLLVKILLRHLHLTVTNPGGNLPGTLPVFTVIANTSTIRLLVLITLLLDLLFLISYFYVYLLFYVQKFPSQIASPWCLLSKAIANCNDIFLIQGK